jgi:RNA polymerase sigma-70 factor (ECF subfamily)
VQFAFCRLHSLADAEDVVQDVLVQAYRDRERHRHVEHVEAFLFRMVANRSTDLLRKRRHSAGSLDDLAQEPAVDEGARVAGRLQWVEALLVRLPARQAEVIRLRVYADLSFEAVAESLGCSIPTVKSRFRYGIQKLRRVLESRGGEK